MFRSSITKILKFNIKVKKDLLGILGLIIGIFGIGLSIYFYYQAERHIEAVFLVEPTRTEILSVDRISNAPISVIKANGEKVNDDVTSVRFYFWNNGNESIKKDNILKPIKLDVISSGAEILDYKILKISRDVTGINLARNKDNPKSSLDINFTILEPGDGFTGQILLEGQKDAVLSMAGTIEHTPGIITNSEMVEQRFWPVFLDSAFLVLGTCILIFGIPMGWVFGKDYILKKTTSESVKKIITFASNSFAILFALITVGGLIVSCVINPINNAKKEAAHSVISVAPVAILPNKQP